MPPPGGPAAQSTNTAVAADLVHLHCNLVVDSTVPLVPVLMSYVHINVAGRTGSPPRGRSHTSIIPLFRPTPSTTVGVPDVSRSRSCLVTHQACDAKPRLLRSQVACLDGAGKGVTPLSERHPPCRARAHGSARFPLLQGQSAAYR